MIARWTAEEFERADTDKSGTISRSEFTVYVNSMTRWMRDELLQTVRHEPFRMNA